MASKARGCLLIVAGLAAVAGIVAIAFVLSRSVDRGTVVELVLGGPIVEERDETLAGKIFQGDVTTLDEVRSIFERAARDDRVAGVMAVIKQVSMGYAKAQEIRSAVGALRDAGKWAMAYMDTAGEVQAANGTYFVASAFDDLTLSPAGDVNLTGVIATTPFLRGTFDKLGIYPDFDHIGKYKNAKDVYTEKDFTDAHREATTALVEDLFRGLVEGVAASRKKTAAEVEALVDRGPFTGREALEAGLVDHLAYYDEFREAAEHRNGGKLRTLNWKEYLKRTKRVGAGRHRIAVVHGTGLVLQGKSGYDPNLGFVMGSDSVAGAIRRAREDKSVKAIILRVDSPGGSAVASDIIWRETQLARKEKPVIASMSDVAASGGYWVSCGADRIVAEPSTITASIGVVYGKFVLKGLYDWIGLSHGQIQKGRNANFWSDLQPWTPEQKEGVYWKFMNRIYEEFLAKVAGGRGMTREAVHEIAQGRVWTGRRAKELGLIDELGGFPEAVKLAREMAKIPEAEGVRFLDLPEKPSFWESLWGGDGEASYDMPRGARALLQEIQPVARLALLSGEPMLLSVEAMGVSP